MKKFCEDLREHAKIIIDYEKKKQMIPLISEENKSYHKQKVCYICKKEFSINGNDKKYCKVRDDLYLSKKESRKIIEFLAKMRNINNYKSKSNDRLHEIFILYLYLKAI